MYRFSWLLLVSSISLGIMIFSWFDQNFTNLIEVSIFSMSSIEFSFLVILDKVSLSFGFVVVLISSCVFAFACSYMKEDMFFNRFIIVLLSFVISMNLLIYSGSIFLLLMGWDGLGITSFVLIIYYQNKESLSAGFLTLAINRLGDVVIVSSMFFLVLMGSMNIFPMSKEGLYLVMVLLLASLTKSAQYPFSPWLPAAMAAPTPVSALVHSSTLVTAGVYLVIRLSLNIPLDDYMCSILCFSGSVTCFLGGTAAIWEMDLKKIIALSTLSQLGVMMFSLGIKFPFMALFHLYTHAMFKALLFLVAGAILMFSFGTQDLRLLGAILFKAPMLVVLQNISSLCLMGAPFLSAFYSKHCILELMVMSNLNFFSMIVMLCATMSTTIYVFRSLKVLCWGKVIINICSVPNSFLFYFPFLILGLMSIISGKMFVWMNYSFIETMFIPLSWTSMISLLGLIGGVVGLLIKGQKKSYLFSSLMFLVPSWNMVIKPFSKVFKGMMSLDYGWLEPNLMLGDTIFKSSKFLSNLFLWPQLNFFSFFRIVLFFIWGSMLWRILL